MTEVDPKKILSAMDKAIADRKAKLEDKKLKDLAIAVGKEVAQEFTKHFADTFVETELINGKTRIKTKQGPIGPVGPKPTTHELLMLIKPLIPPVQNGINGLTPTKAELVSLIKPLIPPAKEGKPGLQGLPGLRGSPDDGVDIVRKINALPEDGPKIKAIHLEADLLKSIKLGGGGAAQSPVTTTGTTSPLTTKGDLYTFSTTNARLSVGTNGQVLSADSTQATGLKWIALSGGGDMVQATYDPAGIGEQLVGLTATQTLTNKTLTSPKINENVALTTTATKLNFLTSAAGTTGTTSTNIVFSTSPTLTTPVLGAATYTTLSGGAITDSALTAGRITFAGTAGLLSDSAKLLFNSTTAATTIGDGTDTNVLFTQQSLSNSIIKLSSASSSATQGAFYEGFKSRGTIGSPTVISSGDAITIWLGAGYDGAGFQNTGLVSISADGTISSGIVPGKIIIQTSNSSGVLTTGLTIDSSQLATFTGAITNGTSGVFTTGTIELGAASDTTLSRVSAGKIAVEGVNVVTTSSTDTLTNKTMIATSNVVEEMTTTASSATPTPTGGSLRNFFSVTALAAGATFAAPSGTPVDNNILTIRIKDNGTARSLAFNAIYRASTDLALPTITTLSKTMYLNFRYNSADSKWDFVAQTNGF